jgi:two-component system response regulator HydG
MNKDAAILVIDSNKSHGELLVRELSDVGASIDMVATPRQGIEAVQSRNIDIIIADMNFDGDMDGLDLLEQTQTHSPSTKVILLSEHANIETCKQALRQGAYDYLVKPVDIDQLCATVEKVLSSQPVEPDDRQTDGFVFDGVVGRSRPMHNVFHVVKRIAPTGISVLIEGESGSGKELVARAIHANSPRKNNNFVPINCAGLTESLLESELFGHAKGAFTGATVDRKGRFEIADKGTIFFDEIGDMPAAMQAKLLRVLEDGIVIPVGSNRHTVVDVRVVSATNHDLAKLVEEKKFRQDLYFRIKGVSITLPSLRNRASDIPELFGYFLKEACLETGLNLTRITEPAMSLLQSYYWPGNLRQLKNVVRTMVVMCLGDTLDVQDIPPEIRRTKRLSGRVLGAGDILEPEAADKSLEEMEAEHIRMVLEKTEGNRSEAAKILKIGERTLYRKIKEYGL